MIRYGLKIRILFQGANQPSLVGKSLSSDLVISIMKSVFQGSRVIPVIVSYVSFLLERHLFTEK